jgi:outer membrane biosynthesis protein TonB
MASITEITLEQLASVDAKLLFKALEMRLSSAGVIKKRGSKKASVKTSSSDGDDAASETSRSVGEGTKKWNDQTKVVAALVKEALAGEKGGAGFHLKVLSYLKTEKSLAADAEPSLDQVTEAVTFLKAHSEWVSPNQKAKAAKAEAKPSGEEPAPSGAAAASSAAVKVVVKKTADAEAPKKKGRPAKSEEEKAAEAAAKKAEKDAAAAAKKAAKEAEKAAKKAEKKSAPAAKKAEPPAKTDADEEEESELVEIELEGVSYFWDSASGSVFENIDGHTGDRIGSWDGASADINRD